MNVKQLDRLRLRLDFLKPRVAHEELKALMRASDMDEATPRTFPLFCNFALDWSFYRRQLRFPRLSFLKRPKVKLGVRRRRSLALYCQYINPAPGHATVPSKHVAYAMHAYLGDLGSLGVATGSVSISCPYDDDQRQDAHYTGYPSLESVGVILTANEVREALKIFTLLQRLRLKDLDDPPPAVRDWQLVIYEDSQL